MGGFRAISTYLQTDFPPLSLYPRIDFMTILAAAIPK